MLPMAPNFGRRTSDKRRLEEESWPLLTVSSAGTVTQTHVTLPDWSAPFSAAASDATLPEYSPHSPLFRPSQLWSSQTVSF